MKTEDDDARDDDESSEQPEKDVKSKPARGDDDDDARAKGSDDDDDDDDEKPPTEVEQRAVEAKPKKAAPAAARRSAAKPKARKSAGAPARVAAPTPASSPMSRGILLALIGIAIGAAGGWFLRDAQAKGRAPFKRAAAPASSGVSGECKTWQDKICGESGEASAGCAQARSAAELIPNSACGMALEEVPSTLARLKAARESCTELVTKLCDELGKETDTCKMVTEKTERLSPENCRSMLENYPAVIAQLKMMQEQGGAMGGGRPMGGRPMPPGGPGGPGMPPPPNPH